MLQSLGAKAFALPTPVFLVGVYDPNGKPNIMTAAWGGICASHPPCIGVSVRKSRWTYAALVQRKAFTLSIPSSKLAAQADFAGMHSGANLDKFAALGLTPHPAEHVDAPYVDECPVVIELALVNQQDLGSHTLFIGEVLDLKVEQSCLREEGIPDPARLDPLLYVPLAKEYWSIGDFVARAYSAGHALSRTAVLEQV